MSDSIGCGYTYTKEMAEEAFRLLDENRGDVAMVLAILVDRHDFRKNWKHAVFAVEKIKDMECYRRTHCRNFERAWKASMEDCLELYHAHIEP